MLLSRFWYIILAIAAAAGMASAILASNLVNEGHAAEVEDDLRRDRFEVEAILKLDARSRLDAIAPIAANADVRAAMRQARARRPGEPVPPELATRLRTKLSELNQQLAGFRGDLVFAVDQDGWIVAAIAPGRIPDGAGLGQFPLVARALEGYVRDDVWVYNDAVYRMAARPIIEGGQYVGALVHGKRFDDQLAELLSTRLGSATVGFFHGETMVAGYMPVGAQAAPRRDELGMGLAQILTDERLQAGERTEPRQLSTGGLAVYSLVTGTARQANVGYAIARPVPAPLAPLGLVANASQDDWMRVVEQWPLWTPVLAIALLMAMFVVWLERDRPLGKLRRAASTLTGPEARFTVTDFGGQYRKIAQHVNDALDQVAQHGGAAGPKRKSAANLDEILGPSPEEAGPNPSFFGFAQQGQAAPEFPSVPAAVPATPAGGLPPAPPARPPGPPAAAVAGPRPPPPKPPGPPPAAARKPAPPVPAEPPAPLAEANTPDPTQAMTAPPTTDDAGGRGTGQRKQLKRTLVGVPPPAEEEDDDDDDGATMVARVPDELLAQSASLQAAGAGADDEEKHFKEVFEKFVETKKQCGEPTAGLTFPKFLVTLQKNRDQIVSRHGARKVRFNVYVKNGKAALKATPIRE